MYRKIESNSSLKFGTVLAIVAVLASAMAVMLILHIETGNSSAQIIDSGQCGDDLTFSYLSDGTLTISGTGGMYDYSETDSPWCGYHNAIIRIVIEDGVTSLGGWCFHDCNNLLELTLPITLNSVKSNEHPAFAGCANIKIVNFTYGTNGYGFDYDAYPVNDCWYQNTPWYLSLDTVKEINFADGIKGIGSDALREQNITSIVIPDSVVALGNYTFYNCAELTDLTIPISLRPFCSEAYPSFKGCIKIENVTLTRGNGIPFDYDSVTSKTYYLPFAPWSMSSVAKKIIISDDITTLGDYMFYYCNMKELSIPNNILLFGVTPFNAPYDNLKIVTITPGNGDYCNRVGGIWEPWYKAELTTLTVAEGVTHLGKYGLTGFSVENLILPNTLSALGDYTFNGDIIKNLTIPISLNATWTKRFSPFDYVTGIEKVTFTPGTGYGMNYSTYNDTDWWHQYTPWYRCKATLKEIVLEDGIKSIGSETFSDMPITSIVIPDSVQSLGRNAFYNCYNLTDLTIPISVCALSGTPNAFDRCDAVSTLKLTAGETGIGWDYSENSLPFWCMPGHKVTTIEFGWGITYFGAHSLDGYQFFTPAGEVIKPVAENLAGHTFNGVDGVMYQIGSKLPAFGCEPLCTRIQSIGVGTAFMLRW